MSLNQLQLSLQFARFAEAPVHRAVLSRSKVTRWIRHALAVDAERVLKRVKGIAVTHFTSADVVRHPLVARIVDAYDAPRRAAAARTRA